MERSKILTHETSTHIYDEVHVPNDGKALPTFPKQCPKCNAPMRSQTPLDNYSTETIYACGGSYDHKPQYQNHTNKWWGSCPIEKELQVERLKQKS